MNQTIRDYSRVWLWAGDMRLAGLALRLRMDLQERNDKRNWRRVMCQAKRVSRAYGQAIIRR